LTLNLWEKITGKNQNQNIKWQKNKNNQKSNIQIEAHFGLQLRYSSATVKRSVVAAGDLSFFFCGERSRVPATDEKSIRHDAKPEKSMHRNPKNKKVSVHVPLAQSIVSFAFHEADLMFEARISTTHEVEKNERARGRGIPRTLSLPGR